MLGPHLRPSVRLSSCEKEYAAIVRVVHKVLDRIRTGCGTSISSGGTVERRGLFRRCVVYAVVVLTATGLKGVIKAEPVSDFMGSSVTEIVRNEIPTWKRFIEHHYTVVTLIACVV